MTNGQKLKNYFLLPNLFLLGFIALIAQTIFFREVIVFVNGNELIFGALVSVWLLAGALGSYLSFKISQKEFFIKLIHAVLILLLPTTLFVVRFISPIIIPTGESANFFEIFLISFLSLFPLNFFLTAEFLICLKLISEERREGPGFSYFLESLGGFAGASVFTFYLSGNWLPWQVITALSVLMVVVSFFLYQHWEKVLPLAFTLFFIVFSLFLPQTERLTRSFWFSDYDLSLLFTDLTQIFRLPATSGFVLSRNTPFQNITITRRANQVNLFLNGQPSGFTGENPMMQEIADLTLALRAKPEKILIFGLSTGQLVREVLKHPAKEVVVVELDPQLLRILKENLPPEEVSFLEDRRLKVFFSDARRFLKENKEEFNVAIFNFPDPQSTILARLYTVEFMKIVKNRLAPGGILSFVISTNPEHFSREFYEYNGSLVSTVRKVFPFIKVVPSFGAHILASTAKISLSSELILKRLKERKIRSRIDPVNLNYKIKRAALFNNVFEEEFEVNTDDRPISIYLTSLIWQSIEGRQPLFRSFQLFLYRFPYALFIILTFLPQAFLFLKKRTELSIMFSVSLAGMMGELSLIYIYQLVSGYIYSHLGFLLASFMLGLSLGAFIFRAKGRGLGFTAASLSLLLLLLPLAKNFPLSFFTLPFCLLLIALLGFLVGSAFPLIVAKLGSEQSNLVYSIDLLGGALGAFLGGALMLPLLGVTNSNFLVAVVVLLSILQQKLGR